MSGLLKSLLLTTNREAIAEESGPVITGPYSVTTSNYDAAIRYSVQNLSFFAAGRHWIFYADAGHLYFRSSTDGETWTDRTDLGLVTASGMIDAYFDGTHVHYARVYDQILYYRRGTPNANGTITWSAAEQIVYDNTGVGAMLAQVIAVLSGGYPAIAYVREVAGVYNPRVKISDNNDGTWSGAEVELKLHNTSSPAWCLSLHTLGSGLYVTYQRDNNIMLGRVYSGGAWQGEESTGYDVRIGVTCSVTIKDSEVHVTFVEDTDRDIYHGYRSAGGVWQAKVAVQVGTYTNYAVGIVSSDTMLYIFWASTTDDKIYYKKSSDNGATWTDEAGTGNPQELFVSPAEILYTYDIQAYETIMSNHIGVMWLTGAAAPYTIYFGDMEFPS